jgi:hypothetical protein
LLKNLREGINKKGGCYQCRNISYKNMSVLTDLLCSSVDPNAAYQTYHINLLKPTGHVMHQQFNIQQLYVLPTLYLCVLYLSENKQRLVPLTA